MSSPTPWESSGSLHELLALADAAVQSREAFEALAAHVARQLRILGDGAPVLAPALAPVLAAFAKADFVKAPGRAVDDVTEAMQSFVHATFPMLMVGGPNVEVIAGAQVQLGLSAGFLLAVAGRVYPAETGGGPTVAHVADTVLNGARMMGAGAEAEAAYCDMVRLVLPAPR